MLYADHVERHGMTLFQHVCEMDLKALLQSTLSDPTSPNENAQHGSKSEILNIRRWKAAKNSSNVSAIRSLSLDGIVAN